MVPKNVFGLLKLSDHAILDTEPSPKLNSKEMSATLTVSGLDAGFSILDFSGVFMWGTG